MYPVSDPQLVIDSHTLNVHLVVHSLPGLLRQFSHLSRIYSYEKTDSVKYKILEFYLKFTVTNCSEFLNNCFCICFTSRFQIIL